MSSLSGNPGQWKLRGRAKPFLWAPTSSDLSQLITQCPDSTGHTRNECTRVLLYRIFIQRFLHLFQALAAKPGDTLRIQRSPAS
ncbi:hypothetical protein AV530_012132 [Patagioenas fasciata monilis]|uniref:Uncharacterized protein n=1 Tax=Patagioenas fasciata monilis TaxID=372326 RepID=A0A1V4JV56_PATFA|nr:hypothetical protein AV530_012132 [Patagioenas fasciata monilis]